MSAPFPNPEIIGTFHQFGFFGIPYQVLRPAGQKNNEWQVEIEIPESGERLEYGLKDVLNDPEAK